MSRDPELSPLETDEAEDLWQRHQRELAEVSSAGELVMAEGSGHAIPLAAPEVIVNAVRSVVAAAD